MANGESDQLGLEPDDQRESSDLIDDLRDPSDLIDDEVELDDLSTDDDATAEDDASDGDGDGEDEVDELRRQAQAAILKAIPKLAGGGDAEGVLDLAEAYAWLEEPDSDHG